MIDAPPRAAAHSEAVAEALDEIRRGRPVVVEDVPGAPQRLAMAAQLVTPAAVELLLAAGSPPLTLCVAADYAGDEASLARAVQAAIDLSTRSCAVARVPVAHAGGVLVRAEPGEAAADLARLAGLSPAGLTCTLREPARHGLARASIRALIAHRAGAEHAIERVVETRLPTVHGDFRAVGFRERPVERHHLALVKGRPAPGSPVLAGVHTGCLAGALQACQCRPELEAALRRIGAAPRGVLVHLEHDGDGPTGLRCAEQDVNRRVLAGVMLADLGVSAVRLLTSDPRGVDELGAELGVDVVEKVAPCR